MHTRTHTVCSTAICRGGARSLAVSSCLQRCVSGRCSAADVGRGAVLKVRVPCSWPPPLPPGPQPRTHGTAWHGMASVNYRPEATNFRRCGRGCLTRFRLSRRSPPWGLGRRGCTARATASRHLRLELTHGKQRRHGRNGNSSDPGALACARLGH